MKIRDIFTEQKHFRFYNEDFKGIHFDTRLISSGQIFIAIKTQKNDGHKYVKDAVVNKNIAGAIIEKSYLDRFDSKLYEYLIPVDNVEDYLIKKAKLFLKKINLKYKIAITGTVGKTTTKELSALVLNKKYKVYKSFKNFNNFLGLIYNIFNISSDKDIAIFEIGTNHPGEINLLSSIIQPNIAIITKVGYGHLEFFKNLENVAKEKSDIFRHLQKDKIVLFNKNDSIIEKYISNFDINKKIVVEYGKNYFLNGNILKYLNSSFVINSYILPYIDNFVLVLALARVLGIDEKYIKQAIDDFHPVDKRMQIIELGNNIIVNDCYNSNPDSMELFIKTAMSLAEEKKRGLLFVLGDMFELGNLSEDLHKKIGRILIENNDKILKILTIGDYSKYFIENNPKGEFLGNSKDVLFNRLKEYLKDDIIICIKGSRGMKMEDITERIIEYVKST